MRISTIKQNIVSGGLYLFIFFFFKENFISNYVLVKRTFIIHFYTSLKDKSTFCQSDEL